MRRSVTMELCGGLERSPEREHDGEDAVDVEDAFGAHDIEYWVRRGDRLVPATEEDIARIRAWESQRVAWSLVAQWEREERRPVRRWLARWRGWLRRDAGHFGEERQIRDVAEERPAVRQVEAPGSPT